MSSAFFEVALHSGGGKKAKVKLLAKSKASDFEDQLDRIRKRALKHSEDVCFLFFDAQRVSFSATDANFSLLKQRCPEDILRSETNRREVQRYLRRVQQRGLGESCMRAQEQLATL